MENWDVLKKKCTVGRFLYIGPKKGVEHEYKVYFDKIWDNKISPNFFEKKSSILDFFAWK